MNCGAASLDQTSLLQRAVGTVLVDGLQGASGKLHFDEFVQFGHPDALGAEVWHDDAFHTLRDVPSDTAFFFGFTAAVDVVAARSANSGDFTNFCRGQVPV